MLQIFIFLTFFIASLNAHQTGLSYLELKESETHIVSVVYKKPLSDTKGKDIIFHYPSRCQRVDSQVKKLENGFTINNYQLWCGEDGLVGSRIWVEGLDSIDRGVLLHYEKEELILSILFRSQTPFAHIKNEQGGNRVFSEYLKLGFYHILTGYDHLLFIFALLLLSSTYRKLFFAISAFTLAHSITLAFTLFGFISVNVNYTEAMIALSILFLARELVTKSESYTKKHLEIVTFIFGLLHGFGFSNALSSIGFPQNEIALSLFAFNIGIELGQLIFIFIMSVLLLYLKRLGSVVEKFVYLFIPYFIGVVSSYWLIDRVIRF